MNISICLFGIIPRSPAAPSIQESINKQEFAVKLQKNVKKGNVRAERMFIQYPKKLNLKEASGDLLPKSFKEN